MKQTIEKRTVTHLDDKVMVEEMVCITDGSAVVACVLRRVPATPADLVIEQWFKPLND